MAIEFFVFQLEAFQFSSFYEYVAKSDKDNFKIQGQKFVKLLEEVAWNFASLFCG